MANFSMPKGHMVHNRTSDSGVTAASRETAGGDVVRERLVRVQRGPIGDMAATGGVVVIANPADDSVSLVDQSTLAVTDTVFVDGEPQAVAVADGRAYVGIAAAGHDAVVVVDLDSRTVIKTYPLAFGVTALAVSPDGKRVYAGRCVRDRVDVAVIDVTAERVGTIDIGRGPAANIDAMRVDPGGKRMYLAVTDADGSRLIVVDTETSRVSRVVPIGSPIRDLGWATGALYALTSDRAVGGAIHVVDTDTWKITGSTTLGGAPTQLVMSADQTRAYVVDYDRVAVVCTVTLEVSDSLRAEGRPSCVTQGADGTRLYIADYAGGVSVFSVESSIEALYSQFLATDPIALTARRTLEPAGV